MNHHTATQKATANNSVGLVTLEREVEGGKERGRRREESLEKVSSDITVVCKAAAQPFAGLAQLTTQNTYCCTYTSYSTQTTMVTSHWRVQCDTQYMSTHSHAIDD